MAVLILAAVIWSVGSNWAQVSDDLRRVPPGTLALALALGFAAPVLTMMGWRRLLADLGTTLPVPPAAGIFFVGQLGKFVPGSVWSVLAQAEMGARLNVPRRRTAVVGVVSVVLSLATGLAIGIPALPVLLRGEGAPGECPRLNTDKAGRIRIAGVGGRINDPEEMHGYTRG